MTIRPSCWRHSASALPAARSRSASPMSRSGSRRERQGTALGIFGAGNVGAAVTKFAAPIVMVAYGWQTVALGLGGGAGADRGRVLPVHQGRS